MNRFLTLGALLGALVFSFSHVSAQVPEPPPKPAERVYVKKTINVKKTFNLKGKVWVWKGKKAKGQKEGQPPMFRIIRPGAGVRDGQIEGAPDGIHLQAKGAYLDRVVFRTIIEDAVTIDADDVLVKNCQFFGAEDKAIQHNGGTNVMVEKNLFVDCAKAYRLPDHSKGRVLTTFRNNTIYRRGQVHTESSKVDLTLRENTWYGVRNPILNKDSTIHEAGNRFLGLWQAFRENGRPAGISFASRHAGRPS